MLDNFTVGIDKLNQSIIYSNDAEKREASEKLNDEVEKWLASGGKIQPLNHGESLGRVDYSRSHNAKERKVEVKKEKSKPVKPKAVKPKKPVAVKSSSRKSLTPEGLRLRNLTEAKNKAIKEGLIKFEGECKHHGITTYLVYSDGYARCHACKCERQKKRTMVLSKRNGERQRANRTLMLRAVDMGYWSFIGDCSKHGKTTYKIYQVTEPYSRFVYLCLECKR